MPDTQQRTTVSTQIRNFYSEGLSYLNVSFFNTNLSFKFYPWIVNNSGGMNKYDMKNGQSTTVNFEGAAALHQLAEDIIAGKTNECNLPIPCAAGASLNLERKLGQDGSMETIFSITKNNVTIPYKFSTIKYQTKENGQIVTKTLEAGLDAFSKTIDGYLIGINASRHLDKLTDEFVKNQQSTNSGNQQYGNNYGRNGYNKGQFNNKGRYGKSYPGSNNGYNNQQNGGNWTKQQDMSSYNIQN